MRLQKNTSLALYSVVEFASDEHRQLSVREIARKYGVSVHHLAKVLAELTRAGIVESVRGARGGYRFTGNARRLTLLDVIELFEPLRPARARIEPGERTPVGRALGGVLGEIDEITRATFGSITLATMQRLVAKQAYAPVRAARRGTRA